MSRRRLALGCSKHINRKRNVWQQQTSRVSQNRSWEVECRCSQTINISSSESIALCVETRHRHLVQIKGDLFEIILVLFAINDFLSYRLQNSKWMKTLHEETLLCSYPINSSFPTSHVTWRINNECFKLSPGMSEAINLPGM